MTIVDVHNLSKAYENGVNALNNVSFSLNKGEFVSVIGPSGAGKTSLIRMMNGMIKPTAGDILYYFYNDYQAINKASRKNKRLIQRSISTIYQDFCLVEQLSTLQNVLNADLANMKVYKVLLGIFTAEQKNRAKEALDVVGLQDKVLIPTSKLSGGQKQRTAIARAIMQKSQLLLADEPVASLDPYTSRQILSLLKKLQKDYGLTILMNSHNVDMALEFSDRILGINNGRLVLDEATLKVTKDQIEMVYNAK